jgi:integrase
MAPSITPSPPITFTVIREAGKIARGLSSSEEINHFLRLVKLNRAYHTWLNYALDLKLFFSFTGCAPQDVTRQRCLDFIEEQESAGRSSATINRRLAALSSLFQELNLLDPERFPGNPVFPLRYAPTRQRNRSSLYRKKSERIPEVLSAAELQSLFAAMHTWRDRTLILLMWVSCLRISEALGIRLGDIECGRRSIRIRAGKGGQPRTVYMDAFTLEALSRYLDLERGDLAPDEPHVFLAMKGPSRGRPLPVNTLQKLLAYHARRVHLSDVHAHRLRHTGITELVQKGMAEPAIRQMVGHRHPASLEPYLHLSQDYLAAEFDAAQHAFDHYANLEKP